MSILTRLGKESDDISSVVLVKSMKSDTEVYFKSNAALKVFEQLGPLPYLLSSTLGYVFPLQIRDAIYDIIASNRYNFLGRRNECRVEKAEDIADRFLK